MRYLFILLIVFIFTGCGTYSDLCEKEQYTGIVLSKKSRSPYVYCSNGKKTPNKKSFITSHGNKSINSHLYFELRN